MRDLIIIGAGPAGITSAIYSARKKLDFIVITKDIGGQAALSGSIENYTGYQFITGPELALKFREHLNIFKFDLIEGDEVTLVKKINRGFEVKTSSGKSFLSKTIIVASGKKPKPLNVPGEAEFKNRGITYCATCDGPIFAGKDVAIIGGGNSALDAGLQMVKIASKVYLVNITENLTGDKVMQEKLNEFSNVEILNSIKVLEIFGDKFVKGIKVMQGEKVFDIFVSGVFVEIGLIPNSEFINFVKKNELGEIIVDCATQTSEPGCFAAGDVTNVLEKQIIVAAGEGAKAALSAFKYISTNKW